MVTATLPPPPAMQIHWQWQPPPQPSPPPQAMQIHWRWQPPTPTPAMQIHQVTATLSTPLPPKQCIHWWWLPLFPPTHPKQWRRAPEWDHPSIKTSLCETCSLHFHLNEAPPQAPHPHPPNWRLLLLGFQGGLKSETQWNCATEPLSKDHPCFKTTGLKRQSSYLHVNELLTKDHYSFHFCFVFWRGLGVTDDILVGSFKFKKRRKQIGARGGVLLCYKSTFCGQDTYCSSYINFDQHTHSFTPSQTHSCSGKNNNNLGLESDLQLGTPA